MKAKLPTKEQILAGQIPLLDSEKEMARVKKQIAVAQRNLILQTQAVINATIERCAQVAEKDGWHKAADAIRNLKSEEHREF